MSDVDARTIVDDRDVCFFFEHCVGEVNDARVFKDAKTAGYATGKLMLNAGAKRANERGCGVHELGIDAAQIASVLALREQGTIGPQAADTLFGLLCATKDAALAVAESNGLLVVRDEGKLMEWVDAAIAANAQAADDVRAGKMAAMGRLVGAVMRLSGGKAEAGSVTDALKSKLGQ